MNPAQNHQFERDSKRGENLRTRRKSDRNLRHSNGSERQSHGRGRPRQRLRPQPQYDPKSQKTNYNFKQQKSAPSQKQVRAAKNEICAIFVVDEWLAINSPGVDVGSLDRMRFEHLMAEGNMAPKIR